MIMKNCAGQFAQVMKEIMIIIIKFMKNSRKS